MNVISVLQDYSEVTEIIILSFKQRTSKYSIFAYVHKIKTH